MGLRAQRPGVVKPAGFGKRGQVTLTPPPSPATEPEPAVSPMAASHMKWMGGGLAAIALLVLVGTGTGGGGLLGGLIGGLLGHHLAKRTSTSPVTAGATQPARPGSAAAATTSVQRGGFGAPASSGSGFFSGS